MKALILSLFSLFLLISIHSQGQENAVDCIFEIDSVSNRQVLIFGGTMAEVEGGNSALIKKIAKVEYTGNRETAIDKYFIGFIVEVDGTLSSPRSLIAPEMSEFDKNLFEALNDITWMSAICDRKKEPCMYQLPLRICLK